MTGSFQRIGVAIGFSPRGEALLAETNRLRKLWNAQLIIIHVGDKTPEGEQKIDNLLLRQGIQKSDVTIKWKSGKASTSILTCCKEEGIDLLVAGALKQENVFQYYLGSVARKILRKAGCSVLMLTSPSLTPKPYQNVVANAEDSPYVEQALRIACGLCSADNARWLHIIREIKMYGLTMSIAEQGSEEEYDDHRHGLVNYEIEVVEKLLARIPHENVRVNIKILAGKSGFELSKFAEKKRADLLIVGAPPRRLGFFDRMFPHDLEYIFADLPCDLLIVRPRKEAKGG